MSNSKSASSDLMEKKLNLADREAEFGKLARPNQGQTAKKKRGLAIDREIRSYDDKLKIQKASLLKISVFGYSVGGLTPPADMTPQCLVRSMSHYSNARCSRIFKQTSWNFVKTLKTG